MESDPSFINSGDGHPQETRENETGEEDDRRNNQAVQVDIPSSIDGRAFVDAEDNLKFYPPLYRQRYEIVGEILKDERWVAPVEKIVEFGCAELAMFAYFKQISNVSKVLMVDIDQNILEYYNCRAAPLTCDYLNPRERPLHVEVLCGSVADCDVRLLGTDAVVCIELIEHLEQDIVEKLEKTIFGFIEPKIAIFTTPNSDFNVLLKGMQGKFRHYDHKFEWSRSEFRHWTGKVTSQYPHYHVEISGVGVPPEGHEDVGCCSQLALFIRDNDYNPELIQDAHEVYTVSRIYDHPVKAPDLRSDRDKLCDEVQFQLQRLAYFDCYRNDDDDFSHVPLVDLTNVVKVTIPTVDIDLVRSVLLSAEVTEKDGNLYVAFDLHATRSESSFESERDNEELVDHGLLNDSDEERWDSNSSPMFDESSLVQYHIALATFDNAMNLMHERHSHANTQLGDRIYSEDSGDDDEDVNLMQQQDCERMWNLAESPEQYRVPYLEKRNPYEANSEKKTQTDEASALSPPDDQDYLIFNSKPEPITDSGVDLSPFLNQEFPQDEIRDIYQGSYEAKVGTPPVKVRELPKSTSVEVLHLDGSCTLKRPAGLEFVEFAPSTSVALCYTGQTYSHSDKVSTVCDMSLSSERKSLDGSLVRDVADSCSLDFAGDSGYPNSSSLHHDVDVDLTPEQVDDISSENEERSNQSLSDDDMSDSSDRPPAFFRRVIHPRHPIIPIFFENVENGDLANNNRDGEGNNAVAPQGDEREFVALVQEGEMQPLLAAPVVDDVILPHNADPFPDWLMELLRIEEEERAPAVKISVELECDEGLGEDTI